MKSSKQPSQSYRAPTDVLKESGTCLDNRCLSRTRWVVDLSKSGLRTGHPFREGVIKTMTYMGSRRE